MGIKRAISVTSGGGDSIADGLMMLKEGYHVTFLHVLHGQKSEVGERLSCEKIVSELVKQGFDCSLRIVNARWLGQLGVSALTSKELAVPDGLEGVYQSTMPKIFTPGRNTVFLGIAGAVAEAEMAEVITFGCNQSEIGYADNTKDFIDAYTKVLEYSTLRIHPKVISPEWDMDKVEIYKWSFDHGFGWAHAKYTWPCDDAGESFETPARDREDIMPCGRCGCCRNRRIVFKILNTKYPDSGYSDLQQYADRRWFDQEFMPTIQARGIPKSKWFSEYAEELGCKVI